MTDKNKIKSKIIISWILVIIWASVIFNLSAKTAEASTVQSQGLISTFTGLVGAIIPDEETMTRIDGIVRETAHGIEYFILGMLLFNALLVTLNYRKQEELLLTAETGIECTDKYRALNCFICSLLICCIYAITDEIHQIPIPGRTFQVLDLIIDFTGSLLGITTIKIGHLFIKKKQPI